MKWKLEQLQWPLECSSSEHKAAQRLWRSTWYHCCPSTPTEQAVTNRQERGLACPIKGRPSLFGLIFSSNYHPKLLINLATWSCCLRRATQSWGQESYNPSAPPTIALKAAAHHIVLNRSPASIPVESPSLDPLSPIFGGKGCKKLSDPSVTRGSGNRVSWAPVPLPLFSSGMAEGAALLQEHLASSPRTIRMEESL